VSSPPRRSRRWAGSAAARRRRRRRRRRRLRRRRSRRRSARCSCSRSVGAPFHTAPTRGRRATQETTVVGTVPDVGADMRGACVGSWGPTPNLHPLPG
jgi:hypothetical protein